MEATDYGRLIRTTGGGLLPTDRVIVTDPDGSEAAYRPLRVAPVKELDSRLIRLSNGHWYGLKRGGMVRVLRRAPLNRLSRRRLGEEGNLWQPYTGSRGERKGQKGWKNSKTGKVVWGDRPKEKAAEESGKAKPKEEIPWYGKPKVEKKPAKAKGDPVKVKEHIEGLMAKERLGPDDVLGLVDNLLSLTVAQMKSVRDELKLKGSGTKEAMAKKMADEAIAKAAQAATERVTEKLNVGPGKKADLDKEADAMRARHPGMTPLLCDGDFYYLVGSDGEKAAKALGLRITKKDGAFAGAGFTHKDLEANLKKLLKAKVRVAIGELSETESKKSAEKSADKAPVKAAEKAPAKVDDKAVIDGVKALEASGKTLVSLADLADHLGLDMGKPGDKKALHDAVNAMRGKSVSVAAMEGHHGITAKERAAAIDDKGEMLGYIQLRDAEDAPAPKPTAKPAAAASKGRMDPEKLSDLAERLKATWNRAKEWETFPDEEYLAPLKELEGLNKADIAKAGLAVGLPGLEKMSTKDALDKIKLQFTNRRGENQRAKLIQPPGYATWTPEEKERHAKTGRRFEDDGEDEDFSWLYNDPEFKAGQKRKEEARRKAKGMERPVDSGPIVPRVPERWQPTAEGISDAWGRSAALGMDEIAGIEQEMARMPKGELVKAANAIGMPGKGGLSGKDLAKALADRMRARKGATTRNVIT